MSSFWQFFDIQLAIFRRVRIRPTLKQNLTSLETGNTTTTLTQVADLGSQTGDDNSLPSPSHAWRHWQRYDVINPAHLGHGARVTKYRDVPVSLPPTYLCVSYVWVELAELKYTYIWYLKGPGLSHFVPNLTNFRPQYVIPYVRVWQLTLACFWLRFYVVWQLIIHIH